MQVHQTPEFKRWHLGLRDERVIAVIAGRMARLERGLVGEIRALGGRLSELKIDYGPGYRLYFTTRQQQIVWLLFGGHKGTQERDILRARDLLATLENDHD